MAARLAHRALAAHRAATTHLERGGRGRWRPGWRRPGSDGGRGGGSRVGGGRHVHVEGWRRGRGGWGRVEKLEFDDFICGRGRGKGRWDAGPLNVTCRYRAGPLSCRASGRHYGPEWRRQALPPHRAEPARGPMDRAWAGLVPCFFSVVLRAAYSARPIWISIGGGRVGLN